MDVHAPDVRPGEEDVERARLFLESFMFPNRAQTRQEKDVLLQAARYQAAHELTLAREMPVLPGHVRSFQIGHFQMSMDPAERGSREDVCPSAYALLLREGLLYRGVEGRRVLHETPGGGERREHAVQRVLDRFGSPPLRPGVRTGKRDAWLPHRKPPPGNPPPAGIAPQGMPPLPGLPRTVRTGEGNRIAAEDAAEYHVPGPPVSP